MSYDRFDEKKMLLIYEELLDGADECAGCCPTRCGVMACDTPVKTCPCVCHYYKDLEVPATFEVCGRCRGKGVHTHASIGAITGEEWHRDWDYEEREMYMEGAYDVSCEMCKGNRVVPVPDEDNATEEALKAIWEHERILAEGAAMEAAERRYGC